MGMPAPALVPEKQRGFVPAPWMFAVGIAVVLIIGAIVVGYLRNRSQATTQTAAPQPTATPTNTGTDALITQNQWDTTEAALGTQWQINQNEQSQIGTLQNTTSSQAAQLQQQLTQLQQYQQQLATQGQTSTDLQNQIKTLQQQLQALQKAPAAAPTASSPAPAPASPATRTVSVTPWPTQDSTLWGIAQQYLGNGNRWPDIGKLNPSIKNPNLIYAGQQIIIPAA